MKKTFLYAICMIAVLSCMDCREEKEQPKQDSGTGKWSAYQGEMNWYQAALKCVGKGMRLPKMNDFREAYKSGVTKSWENGNYWSSEEFSDDSAYSFYISDGIKGYHPKVFEVLVRCIRIEEKEQSKPTPETVNWSNDQGQMNWKDANANCAGLGMRLPTVNELTAAYKSGVMKSWEGTWYWSSEQFSDDRASSFYIYNGFNNGHRKDYDNYVRCIR